jgi:hypothetical protein
MHISKDGSFYRISRITGPTHNLLMISFAETAETCIPSIEALPPVGDCRHASLNRDKILTEVLEGVEQANRQLGTQYRVAKVRYVENDTGPEATYKHLAQKVVEHINEVI